PRNGPVSDDKRLADSSDKLEPDTVKVVSTGSNGAGGAARPSRLPREVGAVARDGRAAGDGGDGGDGGVDRPRVRHCVRAPTEETTIATHDIKTRGFLRPRASIRR